MIALVLLISLAATALGQEIAPSAKCKSDLEEFIENNMSCQRTCANRFIYHLMGACKPTSACFCKNGYMKLNDDGTGPCVTEDKCSIVTESTSSSSSASSSSSSSSSSFSSSSSSSSTSSQGDCEPGPVCGENEVYSPKAYTCPPQSCASIYTTYMCAQEEPRPGCNCIDGYLRDDNNICIPSDQCRIPGGNDGGAPIKCGKNEVYSASAILCPPQTCANLLRLSYTTYDCNKVKPFAGCICIDGYARDDNNRCIPYDQCGMSGGSNGGGGTPIKCGENEVYSPSAIICPPQSCASIYTDYACANVKPRPGCNCIKGYLRDDNNRCIPSDQCTIPGGNNGGGGTPIKCGENEVYSPQAYTCPPQSCASIYTTYLCAKEEPRPGCNCIDGYLRDDNNICIPNEQCRIPGGNNGGVVQPEQCGYNEVYTDVKRTCPPQVCESLYVNYLCSAEDDPKPGCICIDGHLRNSSGVCIPTSECPKDNAPVVVDVCGPNASYTDCPSHCPRTCNPQVAACITSCAPPGCQCNNGYVKGPQGDCILPENCPGKTKCGYNEVFTENIPVCPPESCDTLYLAYSCAPPPQDESKIVLTPGCKCLDQHLRNSSGICIPVEECPTPYQKPCSDPNAEYRDCASACTPTCEQPEPICILSCQPGRCQCKSGYVLSDGKCILKENCPVKSPCDDPNAVFKTCGSACNPTCENPSPICTQQCLSPRCQCKSGYVTSGGKCILQSDCPNPLCKDRNAEYRECASACTPTCENQNPICTLQCLPGRCQCKRGYVQSNGKCILPKNCPKTNTCPDPNAEYRQCASACTPTCKNRNPICTQQCLSPRCQCKRGYVLDNGKCILPKNCPEKPTCEDPNQEFTECHSGCESSCSNPRPDCILALCVSSGCTCKLGYIRGPDNRCILPEQCATDQACGGDGNARFSRCPPTCEQTCDKPEGCVIVSCDMPGCVCLPGLVKNRGKCVPLNSCPAASKCQANEELVFCKVECPDSFCPEDDSRDVIACDAPFPCPSGCACKSGYLRKSNKDRVCVEASKCPPVKCNRPNEVWSPRVPDGNVERCEDINKAPGSFSSPYSSIRPRCICKKGYYRNSKDVCVPKSQCAPKCSVPARCRPTCAVPNPKKCTTVTTASANVDGCQCKEGYILSETGGKCIKIEDCPAQPSCNGDPNAIVKACPWACPPTCGNPEGARCKKMCLSVGCQCEPGYILSTENGKCILPQQCKGGDPCGPNGEFVDCGFRCPNQYCPVDDSRRQIACKPGRNCPPGCGCKFNYRRLSYDDERCVLASECPAVNCTRQNEKWAPCPSDCLIEKCNSVNDPPVVCQTLLLDCQPKCICQSGFYRDSTELCVPAKSCPGYNPCLSRCAPTCANPNPLDCEVRYNNCCASGYILSARGGKCVRIEDCPQNLGCNRDPNAVVKRCPNPCPATCSQPRKLPCPRACVFLGCECKPGYIKDDEQGICILPNQCPGTAVAKKNVSVVSSTQCGENERFAECKGCGDEYCPRDDSRLPKFCLSPDPCPSGCVCELNHKRNAGGRCIVASDCPPVNCTRPHEVWAPCPLDCNSEYCDAVDRQPAACNSLLLNCEPKCVCKENFFRNQNDDICVSADECRAINKNIASTDCPANEVFVQCKSCSGDSCPVNDSRLQVACLPPNPCPSGCVCKLNHKRNAAGQCILSSDCQNLKSCSSKCAPTCAYPDPPKCEKIDRDCCGNGYVQEKRGGKCIKIEDCPQDSCNGDRNAVVKQCPAPCPSTCARPNQITCRVPCKDIGCQCKNGYLWSEYNGRCILPTECPGGNPCKKNEQFVACAVSCPTQFCPRDDNRFSVQCLPQFPCPSGCVCNGGYYRSNTNKECIVASDCPPVNCTRPDEIWSTKRTTCTGETCSTVGEPAGPSCEPDQRKFRKPSCVCIDNYYRNADGKCVSAEECKKENDTNSVQPLSS